MTIHPNEQQVRNALAADPSALIAWASERIVALGGKSQWNMDDNFETTETLALLAETAYGLPKAGDQPEEALRFYGLAAQARGYDCDLNDMDTDALGEAGARP